MEAIFLFPYLYKNLNLVVFFYILIENQVFRELLHLLSKEILMEQLNPLFSTWVQDAQYDSSLDMLFFDTGSDTYLVSDITSDDWDFIRRVNEFAGQIRQLSHDFSNEVIKNIEKGLLKSKLDNENLEEYLQDITSEETKEALRKLKDTPILEELALKASQREGKIVLRGGLVGTAFWCVYALYRIANDAAPKEFKDKIEASYPGQFTSTQCDQMHKRYLRTSNPEDRKAFHEILSFIED